MVLEVLVVLQVKAVQNTIHDQLLRKMLHLHALAELAELAELEELEALVALLLHVHLLEVLVEVLVAPEELVA